MSYCRRCGAYIPDDFDICPACGARRDGEPEPHAGAGAAAAQNAAETKRDTAGTGEADSGAARRAEWKREAEARFREEKARWEESRREADRNTAESGGRRRENFRSAYDAEAYQNRALAAFCYLGPLFLIPFFTRPDSQFLRYHCNQGLVLMLFCILSSLCSAVPIIGWLAGTAGWFFGIYCFIKGIANATGGRLRPLPLIGQITLIK